MPGAHGTSVLSVRACVNLPDMMNRYSLVAMPDGKTVGLCFWRGSAERWAARKAEDIYGQNHCSRYVVWDRRAECIVFDTQDPNGDDE